MKKYVLILIMSVLAIPILPSTIMSDGDVVIDGVSLPVRVEKKEFSNIKAIDIIQKYGNIVIQEGSGKNVSLEIQYYDSEKEQAQCKVSQKGQQLVIETTKSGGRNNLVKIDYVLIVPAKTDITGSISYGNIKLGDCIGTFDYTLEYSNLLASTLQGKPTIRAMYCNVNITKCEDLKITGSYNQYIIKEARNVSLPDMRYSNATIDALAVFESDLAYSNINLKDLKSSIVADLSYSSIKSQSLSDKISSIKIDGSYSDIVVTLPQNIQAAFSMATTYAKISVAKEFKTSYSLYNKKDFKEDVVGKIGTNTPTLQMSITNKYADINILTTK